MLALSIRQPYAEMILRGEKTIEYRSRPVGARLIGQRFYIYAARKWAGVLSPSLEGGGQGVGVNRSPHVNGHASTLTPALSLQRERGQALPTGVIVGSAVISHVTNGTPNLYEWHLTGVRRYKRPRRPARRPQPVWFNPF